MKAPGIEIRPIHQMSGTRHFNEVFFTDVRVPDTQRLGQVGQGWRISLTTLMNERLAVGDPARPDVDDLVTLCRSLVIDGQPAIRSQAVRERIAEWYARAQGLKFTKFRTMTALSKGETPGPENSIHKLVNASKLQDIASYGMDLMGEAGMVVDEDLVEAWGMFQSALLSSPSARIAGGSDEILKNIIAERVLGLPADIRVDKNRPFNTVPTGNR
jgi:alkylation response protein AidB-like acyl-CoA dehydrogenase